MSLPIASAFSLGLNVYLKPRVVMALLTEEKMTIGTLDFSASAVTGRLTELL